VKIYLAGVITEPSWREHLKKELTNHTFYSEVGDTLAPAYRRVLNAKIAVSEAELLVYFDVGNKAIIEVPWEIGIAMERDIPMLLITMSTMPSTQLCGMASRIFTSVEMAIYYLRKLNRITQDRDIYQKTIDVFITKAKDADINFYQAQKIRYTDSARYH